MCMRIGITYTGSEMIHANYDGWLRQGGLEVVILSEDRGNLGELDRCDGLVLSGGRDIHPQFYNSEKTDYPGANDFDIERDRFEIDCFEKAVSMSLPVLAICRGLQLVNCALGGTLIQDLGQLNGTHRADGIDKQHGVVVAKGTLLSEVTNNIQEGTTNSAHHQAIDLLAKDLAVNCRATDGTIEGVEWSQSKGKPFLLCVQWHPERMDKLGLGNSPLAAGLLKRFVTEVGNNQKHLRV